MGVDRSTAFMMHSRYRLSVVLIVMMNFMPVRWAKSQFLSGSWTYLLIIKGLKSFKGLCMHLWTQARQGKAADDDNSSCFYIILYRVFQVHINLYNVVRRRC
ncbi:hypothetical protein GGS20DRAFT_228846 [Poronia punctata]|nr:hypothetical protein GGS20DRAFT_228846 [Poronia punctata]